MRFVGSLIASDTSARTVAGLLLPFGEPGHTSAGTVSVEPGVVAIPEDATEVLLNIGHDREKPLGWAKSITEQEDGLHGEFHVAQTPAGDAYLAEVDTGVRRGLSVELSGVEIRSGALVAGHLTDVGAVVRPAFPSALVAAENEENKMVEFGVDYAAVINDEDAVLRVTGPVSDENTEQPAEEQPPAEVTAARAPMGARVQAKPRKVGLGDAHRLIAAAFNSPHRADLTAALADVTYTGTAATQVPGWVGELWSGKAYQRKFTPLVNNAPLTGLKINGWRWTTKPVMAPYAGNKAEVPSNAVQVEDATVTAKRLAGAWDIDRALFDFGNQEFVQSFLAALTESYARLSDGEVEDFLIAQADGNEITRGAVPTGVSAAMAGIVDGALAVIDRGTPAFALVSRADYRSVLLTRNDDTLAFLNASLGLENGTVDAFRVIPSAKLLEGEVVVGAKEAATFYELGETPIRVEAEHLSHGGRDLGVFGYVGCLLHDQEALVKVTV